MSDQDDKTTGFTAPYVSWGSFSNLIERMASEGVPMRIDRSYLSNMAGSTQGHLLKSLRDLDLIDDGARPTESLKALVADSESRPQRIANMVQTFYVDALALGMNATQSMLEELFLEKYNVKGSTRAKSIAFFLSAARFGDVPVSPHFKTPKRAAANGGASKRRKPKPADTPPPPSPASEPPPIDQAKAAYIDMLLKKADSEEEMNSDLLDRIERVIGIAGAAPSPTEPGGGDRDP
jgi:Family of unknown function (DUF5343)